MPGNPHHVAPFPSSTVPPGWPTNRMLEQAWNSRHSNTWPLEPGVLRGQAFMSVLKTSVPSNEIVTVKLEASTPPHCVVRVVRNDKHVARLKR